MGFMNIRMLELTYLQSLGKEALDLIAFWGFEALGECYEFKLQCSLFKSIDLASLIDTSIRWKCGTEPPRYFSGIIKSISSSKENIEFCVGPALYHLKDKKRFRVFRNKNVLELIKILVREEVCLEIDGTRLNACYPCQDHWVQFYESNYRFMLRILSEYGLSFYFEHTSENYRLVLVDKKEGFFQKNSVLPMIDFKRAVNSRGESLSLKTHQSATIAETIHYQNQDFLITRMEHSCSQARNHSEEVLKESLYTISITALDAKELHHRYPIIPKPVVSGHQLAKVVEVEEASRLKIRIEEDSENTISYSMPSSQLWVSESQGTQFTAEPLDEVSLHFLEGDPDQGFVSGSLYGESNKAFVAAPEVSGIKTTHHQLSFHDGEDQGSIQIETQAQETREIHQDFIQNIARNSTSTIQKNYVLEVKKGKAVLSAKHIHLIVGSSELKMNSEGIRFNSPQIELHSSGGVGQGLARVSDDHQCPKLNPDQSPHIGGAIHSGSENVLINGQAAARLRDEAECQGEGDILNEGIAGLLINKKPAAYQTAGTLHQGSIQGASSNVISKAFSSSGGDLLQKTKAIFKECWIKIGVL